MPQYIDLSDQKTPNKQNNPKHKTTKEKKKKENNCCNIVCI